MAVIAVVQTSRRGFLRALTLAAGRTLVPSFAIALFSAPRTARAEYVTVALAVLSALQSLSAGRNKGGLALRSAAMDLKLDQVLENQIRIAQAIGVLQKSIDNLSRQIPAFLTYESYRLLWDDANANFNRLKTLNERRVPVERKAPDYIRYFLSLYDAVNAARSRVETTRIGPEGVASMLAAAQALILYVDSIKLAAAIELALPRSLRWRDDRVQKSIEMANNVMSTIHAVSKSRIPEVLAEEQSLAKQALEDMKPPWRVLWTQMRENGTNTDPLQFSQTRRYTYESCFKSQIYAYKSKASGATYQFYNHLDFVLSYDAHAVADEIVAVSGAELTMASRPVYGWSRTWGLLIGGDRVGQWTGGDRAAYVAFANWFQSDRRQKRVPYNRYHALADDPCLLYEQPFPALPPPGGPNENDKWSEVYFSSVQNDAPAFAATAQRHAGSVLNQQILEKCQAICDSLRTECELFKTSIVKKSEEDASLLDRIWGLLK